MHVVSQLQGRIALVSEAGVGTTVAMFMPRGSANDKAVDAGSVKNILLIDDFVWSGATLYETAKKLQVSGIKNIIGFAWVGNTNLKYEIISEM